jgi:hypothetical protein
LITANGSVNSAAAFNIDRPVVLQGITPDGQPAVTRYGERFTCIYGEVAPQGKIAVQVSVIAVICYAPLLL